MAAFVTLVVSISSDIRVDVSACAIVGVSDIISELGCSAIAAVVAWCNKSSKFASGSDVVCNFQIGALRSLSVVRANCNTTFFVNELVTSSEFSWHHISCECVMESDILHEVHVNSDGF